MGIIATGAQTTPKRVPHRSLTQVGGILPESAGLFGSIKCALEFKYKWRSIFVEHFVTFRLIDIHIRGGAFRAERTHTRRHHYSVTAHPSSLIMRSSSGV